MWQRVLRLDKIEQVALELYVIHRSIDAPDVVHLPEALQIAGHISKGYAHGLIIVEIKYVPGHAAKRQLYSLRHLVEIFPVFRQFP